MVEIGGNFQHVGCVQIISDGDTPWSTLQELETLDWKYTQQCISSRLSAECTKIKKQKEICNAIPIVIPKNTS